MKLFKLGVIFLSLVNSVYPFDYTVVFDDENVYKPCEGEEDKFLTKWFDMNSITFDLVGDNEIIVNGNLKGICPVTKDDIVNMEVKLLKMIGGRYGLPIAQINRKNLCKSLFDRREVWYRYMEYIDEEHRHCPPMLGAVYPIQNFSTKNIKLSFPDPNLGGYYRYISRCTFVNNNGPSLCFVSDLRLDKI